ncbi:catalase [Stakelama pacifica]|uniref:Catalase n=1 Tax=Stakelama pacifica TaxID=517720 RepID=A0A4R6FDB0_9SPHN|nr:catalase [Stakelama pacifica]TDN78284.1 catalase [Stakelama pacifica]GGO99711.1 catalase [Stakelama pacifica]
MTDDLNLDKGGAPRQTTEQGYETLTTQQGVAVSDDQNHLKAGERGPMLMEDFHFREKMFHFDHERIPERVVHARGYGAHGYFELTDDCSDVSMAHILTNVGEKTPAFVRFSTVAGNKGSPDLARDVRGFAVKLYTQEGNWDIVGNNIPVFFIQDAIKFPDLIHSAKQEPDRGFPQAQTAHDNFWDFVSLSPESMNMIMWIMSDRTIPRSFRFMEGFGVHTFKLVNSEGKPTFVKFHWKPKQGLQSVVWNEALKLNGADPDFHRRDLWDSIQSGDYPEWELGLQLFDEEFAEKFDFDVLDATKIIPEELVPIRKVGRLVLDRVVDNFFAETEQVAFCTQNIVPGVDFTNDPLLQGRNFSYLDTQLKRLGSPNFTHIPVNAPKCPFRNFQQDGHMAMHNPKGRANYEPNSWGTEDGGPREDPKRGFKSVPEEIEGQKLRVRPERFADHYSQARQFYISQAEIEQKHIGDALTFELSKVETPAIRERMVSHLRNIDEDLAKTVANGLGIDLPKAAPPARKPITDLPASDPLSIVKNAPNSFKGRKLGIFVTDGADAGQLDALKKAVEAAGGMTELVAPKVGGVKLSDGKMMPAKQKIDGGPSVLYDAVALLISEAGADKLKKDAPTRDFIADAFAHLKFIGYTPAAMPLMEKAGIADSLDQGCVKLDGASDAKNFVDLLPRLRVWDREMKVDVDA